MSHTNAVMHVAPTTDARLKRGRYTRWLWGGFLPKQFQGTFRRDDRVKLTKSEHRQRKLRQRLQREAHA